MEPSWKASAALVGDAADGPGGQISFKQLAPLSPVLVNINATGLAVGKHAIHIHAYGDVSKGCASTGPHLRHILVRILCYYDCLVNGAKLILVNCFHQLIYRLATLTCAKVAPLTYHSTVRM